MWIACVQCNNLFSRKPLWYDRDAKEVRLLVELWYDFGFTAMRCYNCCTYGGTAYVTLLECGMSVVYGCGVPCYRYGTTVARLGVAWAMTVNSLESSLTGESSRRIFF